MSSSPDHSQADAQPEKEVRLKDVFSPKRIQVDVEVSSLKRLLEKVADLFARNSHHVLDKDTVFRSLLEREQIGSTWVASGVALPHCRLKSISDAIGVVMRLKAPLYIDSKENKFVCVACGLLVPEHCADAHIRVLARLARAFEKQDLYRRLMDAEDSQDIFLELVKTDSDMVGIEQ